MIQNAKYFTFNNRSLSEFDGLRIGNESNDMYSVQIISNRRLIEEKIPGRKAPYFYNIDDDPLTLQITVALEKPKLVSELRPVFQWLFNNTEYKELWFDTDKDKIFYALFIGSPTLHYIERGTTNQNDRSLIGYMTLTARCNAGSAYAPAIETLKIFSSINPVNTLFNTGDTAVYTSIEFTTPFNQAIISTDTFEGGRSVLRSTVDALLEIDDNQYVYNRRLLYDSNADWSNNQYRTNYLIEVETVYNAPSVRVETQMRTIESNSPEGLFAKTPWTKSVTGAGLTGVDSITYKIRRYENTISDQGTLTSTAFTSITDTTKNWTDGQWIDGEYVVVITSGNAVGQVRKIIGNDPANPKILYIGENIDSQGLSDRFGFPNTVDGITTTSQLPLAGDTYRIHELEDEIYETGTPEILDHDRVLYDKDRNFTEDQYVGKLLVILDNDNDVAESYLITGNTKTTITADEDFSSIFTNSTKYEVRETGVSQGDGNVLYNFAAPFSINIKNRRNNDEVFFSNVEAQDVVTLDMSTRRITANRTVGIYDKWNRGYMKLEPGVNNIEVTIYESSLQKSNNAQTSMTFTYQPIKYL